MVEDELTDSEWEVIEDRLHLIDDEDSHIDIDELLARLADEGTRLVEVRNRLRHRSITTTERVYDHFQRY